VIEQMAVKDGHSFDVGVREIHDDIDRASVQHVDSVQSQRIGDVISEGLVANWTL
jgi:hypothetical protein